MNRRDFLRTGSTGLALAAVATAPARAEQAPLSPTQWTDQHGLTGHLVKDTAPLEGEFDKFPCCPYCGMMRKSFSPTRQLIVYEDDMVDGTCSIHCSAISLALNMDRGPKTIYAGDAGAEDEIKPLVDVADAVFVIDPSKPGTMSGVFKAAFADKAKAEAALTPGARLASFDETLTETYLEMAKDTAMIRKRRAERRAKEAAASN